MSLEEVYDFPNASKEVGTLGSSFMGSSDWIFYSIELLSAVLSFEFEFLHEVKLKVINNEINNKNIFFVFIRTPLLGNYLKILM